MRKLRSSGAGFAAVALVAASFTASAGAAPPQDGPVEPTGSATTAAHRADNRPGPLTAQQEARRQAARQRVRSGQASPDEEGVVQLAADKYAQTTITGTDAVFTILAEFGDAGSGRYGTTPGPLHNQIAVPDRDVDNTTLYRPDFDPAYYHDLFFGAGESFDDFYDEASGGAYGVTGEVSDWVQVPGNASSYGDNAIEDAGGAWQFVEDSGNAWYAAQGGDANVAAIDAYLAQFDTWDRYDWDADGNFDEPDGYLDHFQAIHAGEGEEGNGGEDAIWSHRWYVNPTDYGITGPMVQADDGTTTHLKLGGARIGQSKYWIGDYTTEPENGGLGVFTHEFGHDLGLPDLYDTAGGDNSTAFWTLMSGGSWMNHGGEDLGSTPSQMGPWEKLQLGWLDYRVVDEGADGAFTLGPAATPGDDAQAVIVDVPDQGLDTTYTTPYSGTSAWWTGSADDLNVTLTRSFDLSGLSRATLTAKAWYDIEAGYDFLYAEVSTDAGANWSPIGSPLDGSSNGRWSTLRYSLPAGGPILFRFRYQTDGGVHLPGAFLDDITVKSGGTPVFFDDVESGDNGWTAEGWTRSDGTSSVIGDRYYLLEYRAFTGYDSVLGQGPYNFSKLLTQPNWAERFSYEDGLLVWAVDETYGDNNTSEHVGHGLALPIDARPEPIVYSDGALLGNRRQPFDATFGLQPTGAVSFHREVTSKGRVVTLTAPAPSRPALPTFTDADADAFWSADNPWSSALVAGYGTVVTVTSQGATMGITVDNSPSP